MRRGYPIHGYVGPNGSGKSMAAVWDSIPSLRAGRPVLSTVRLLDFDNPRLCEDDGTTCDHPEHEAVVQVAVAGGEPVALDEDDTAGLLPITRAVPADRVITHMQAHPLWIKWTTWRQLLDVEHCDVIADEITGVASSRDSQSMPSQVTNALVQLRRRDVTFRWTSPAWGRSDTVLRECTQAATFCRGFLSVKVPSEDGQPERAWRHRRLFKWFTYDASLVDDFTQGKRERMKPWVRDLHWGPGSVGFDAYDTFDSVSTIGTVSDHGRCMACGGTRRAPACECEDYVGRSRPRPGARGGPRSRGSESPAETGRAASPEIVGSADGAALVGAADRLVPAGSGVAKPVGRRALLPSG